MVVVEQPAAVEQPVAVERLVVSKGELGVEVLGELVACVLELLEQGEAWAVVVAALLVVGQLPTVVR